MKRFFLVPIVLLVMIANIHAAPSSGFFLPDSLHELTLQYRTVNNLIVLPVSINDSVQVNLILDTGCRNMILFGKQFAKEFHTESKPIEFSGLGSGKHVKGQLALSNRVAIGAIVGNKIPIIVVPEKNLFSSFKNIHGIIGYEIFVKFEIELDFPRQLITFRPASLATQCDNFNYIPMKIVDSRPLLECSIQSPYTDAAVRELVIDTGSSLGLILGVDRKYKDGNSVIGKGLNGLINGSVTTVDKLILNKLEFRNLHTSLIFQRDDYASIGMEVLKDYTIILNYPKAYVGFSKG